MTKLSIGLDLDGVVANWNKAFYCTFLNRDDMPYPLSSKNLDRLQDDEKITSWDYPQDVVGEKNWEWFWREAVPMGRVVAHEPAYRPELEDARKMCHDHGVFVITTRPVTIRNETYEWIGAYRLRPQAVIHVDHKVKRGHGGGQDKAQLIRSLGLVAMLEDNADTAVEVAERTEARSVLLDRPWNRHLDHPGVRRVHSVAEYQEWVEA